MAEEKNFRYGFIILGFFLVMVGMFIMSVEKPQYYITFCVLGVLLVAVGITWSMCQCYPKVGSLLLLSTEGLSWVWGALAAVDVPRFPQGKPAAAIWRGNCCFGRFVPCWCLQDVPHLFHPARSLSLGFALRQAAGNNPKEVYCSSLLPWDLGLGSSQDFQEGIVVAMEVRGSWPPEPALTWQSPWQRALGAATRPCPGKRVWQKGLFPRRGHL